MNACISRAQELQGGTPQGSRLVFSCDEIGKDLSGGGLWRNAHNYSAGPGVVAQEVLEELSQAILEVPQEGVSLLGVSHRSDWFRSILSESEHLIREFLSLSEDWSVLFLQGGASLQFSMAMANLATQPHQPVDWIRGGYWSDRAMQEASSVCSPRLLWDGASQGFRSLPAWDELQDRSTSSILHYVSNETVEGLQFHQAPGRKPGRLVVCDMSSDFLSRPIDEKSFDIIYAHAQKNLGPAGVTVVLLRKELLELAPAWLPPMLSYRHHLEAGSILNTPPVVSIYTVCLVLRWMRKKFGDLANLARINQLKASFVYASLDARADVYEVPVDPRARSLMNACFFLRDPVLQDAFEEGLSQSGFSGLKGHRSRGGYRASLYNAMSLDAALDLSAFLRSFA